MSRSSLGISISTITQYTVSRIVELSRSINSYMFIRVRLTKGAIHNLLLACNATHVLKIPTCINICSLVTQPCRREAAIFSTRDASILFSSYVVGDREMFSGEISWKARYVRGSLLWQIQNSKALRSVAHQRGSCRGKVLECIRLTES